MHEIELVIVCRYNQARSIAIGALLRKFFPQCVVRTCGIEADEGAPIPVITADLCEEWELKKYDRTSTSLQILEEPSAQRWVLAVDNLVYERVRELFPNLEVSNLATYVSQAQLMPVDPTGLSPNDFQQEIAKACVLSLRWIEEKLDLEVADIEAHLFASERALEKFVLNSSNVLPGVGVFIDTDFSYPNPDLWRDVGFDVRTFNPRILDQFDFSDVSPTRPTILISRFEYDFPVRLFLSKKWHTFLRSIAVDRSVALICRNFSLGSRSVIGPLLTINAATTSLHE